MIKFLISLNLIVFAFASGHWYDAYTDKAYRLAASKPREFQKKTIKDKIRVMIIDSGFDVSHKMIKPYFHGRQENHNPIYPDDNEYMASYMQAHGTHVTGLVLHGALKRGQKPKSVCPEVEIIPCRITVGQNRINMDQFYSCYSKAIEYDVHYINISMSGPSADILEVEYLYELQKDGIILTIAAGNTGEEIDKKTGRTDNLAFPASYSMSNMVVVGNGYNEKERYPTSSHGKTIDAWRNGVDILSTLPNNSFGMNSGTSMSSPIYLNELINKDCDALHRR